MTGMTYDEAKAFAKKRSFRHLVARPEGRFAVVMTSLYWVSAAIMVAETVCETPGHAYAVASSNAQKVAELDRSRHSIKRNAAAEGIARMAAFKARSAQRALTDPAVIVPGVTAGIPTAA